jgi:hypothetical protein
MNEKIQVGIRSPPVTIQKKKSEEDDWFSAGRIPGVAHLLVFVATDVAF